ITVSPACPQVVTNATLAFAALALDQFGAPLPVQPSFTWSVAGGGVISPTGAFSAGALPGGPYLVRAEYGGQTGTASLVVRLPNLLPSVLLTCPANGQVFPGQPLTGRSNISITASASDADGTVTKVGFYRNQHKLGESAATPYGLVWSNAAPGTYQLTARAWDNEGACSTSAPVTITIQAPLLSFFVQPQIQGETAVTLYPVASLATGQTVRVSFGVPFPRGFLQSLDTLRVLDTQRNEKPIYTMVLSPWRNLAQADDEPSIRAALVQTDVQFADTNSDRLADPVPLIIQWGAGPRTQPSLAPVAVRSNWVLVADSHFPATNGVYEPPAIAVFSPAWYGQCLIKSRLLPFGSHPDFSAYDFLFRMFGNSAINRVDPQVTTRNLIDYLHAYDPWLFDRPTTLFQLAFRSGDPVFLREAHRAAQFYANHITAEGWFNLKDGPDMKYSYGECLCADYWLTGDDRYLEVLPRMLSLFDEFNIVYTLDTHFWTERHAAYKLLGYVTAYELLGDPELAQKVRDSFGALVNLQDNPIPGAPNTGGLMHTSYAHGEGGSEFIASPWMSTLLVDAVERYYFQSEDPAVKRFVTRLADFVSIRDGALYLTPAYTYTNAAGEVMQRYNYGNSDGQAPYLMPFYLAGPGLTLDEHMQDIYNDDQHALDVSKILALAYYFSRAEGSPNPAYLHTFSDLYQTFVELETRRFIRPGGPDFGRTVFRLPNPRTFNWWFRTTADLDWLVGPETSLETSAETQSAKVRLL
ncbi:MAG: Ig-like domain-containing protein, partial [Verrucomicrobia bacterium]|nr:Ig-like domain-containing protein [Verrucomicrobiota bacterium]